MTYRFPRRAAWALAIAGMLGAPSAVAQSRTYGEPGVIAPFPSQGGGARRDQASRDVLRFQLQNDIRRRQVERRNERNAAGARTQPVRPSPRSSVVVNE